MKEILELYKEYLREVNKEYTLTTLEYKKPTLYEFMEWVEKRITPNL